MAPPKRKLFPEPDPCAAACDAVRNPYRFCPPPCILLCPAFCRPYTEFFPPPPPPIHHHRYHYLLSPAVIAIFALLASAFVIAVSYLLYSRLSSSGRAPSRRQLSSRAPEFDPSMDVLNFHPAWYIATVGLQRSAIESIAVCEYKTGDGLVQGTGCAVCLAEFRDGDALRLLPKCCHAFHVPCIDTWLASRTTCPVCRAPVLPANSSFRPDEARIVEIVGSSSSTGELGSSNPGEFDAETVEEREEAPLRRAASMGNLCVELGEKLNSCSSGCNSLVERSHSCTGKLFSSTRNGLR